MEFDKSHFEALMSEGVRLHNLGEYEAARNQSQVAYILAPYSSFEKGRAARDISARYDRLGLIDQAESWANEAYSIHDTLVHSTEPPTREAYRERSVSAMYVGVMGLRKVIKARLESASTQPDINAPLSKMRQTWSDIQTAKMQASSRIDQKVDQYEINASRRVSMTESLIGSRKLGLQIGAKAVRLAFASESPKMSTSTPELSRKSRLQSKAKALVGGIAALSVNVLASPKGNRRQRLAYIVANRTL